MAGSEQGRAKRSNGKLPHKKWSWYWKGIILLAVLDIILNIMARIPKVCDTYTDYVFGIWLQTYGKVTALFPVSIGEILLILAVLMVLLWIVSMILFIFLKKQSKYIRYLQRYSKAFLAFLLIVLLIMTLNCSMLYGCSKLNVKGNQDKEYSALEIQKLWNYVAAQCNRLAFQVSRNTKGYPEYNGDVNEAVKQAMQKLSDQYPRLEGGYPNPKPLYFSYIMYQANYTGMYFPFSLEANYNTYLSDLGYPGIAAHELSHLKGYIYEDEADFIAYLACTGSEESFLQYSGYLSILGYLQEDYLESVVDDSNDVRLSAQVYEDAGNYYYTSETYEDIRSTESVFEKETVETISDGITDTYMDYYGAEPNYDEVTKLMLAYYDGVLY